VAPHGSVLVVDDTTDNRELLAEFLMSARLERTTAPPASMWLPSAAIVRPDVVLMDLALPGGRRAGSGTSYRTSSDHSSL
jgi:CheY-like chemotaxis protein